MVDTPSPDSVALASRYLQAFWRARETFAHAIAPALSADHGLDLREYGVLRYIDKQDFTPGSLAEMLHLPGYATSRLLDPLIKRGLVQRTVDEADARRYRLHLTPEGRAIIQAVERQVAVMISHFLNDLGSERTELLLSSLEAFASLDTLDRPLAPGGPA